MCIRDSSVGELNENKNQKVIIQALSLLKDKTIHYVLCGKGNQMENLKNLVEEKSIKQNVHFLGYRTDVVDICSQVDVYAVSYTHLILYLQIIMYG